MDYSIGIIGGGFVGQAIKRYFGEETLVYDKYKTLNTLDEVCKQDIIFIAVPTPYIETGFDKSALDVSFKEINDRSKNAIVIIKSTVLPGTTDEYQKLYPDLKIIFNPEFLTESSADNDMRFPDRQIIGFTKQSYTVCSDILALLPRAPFERLVPAKIAEMVKYFTNTWYATKVTFANQIYELCEQVGVDYDTVRECAGADRRMTGQAHLDVTHGGYRGYGGKCLPKDIRAFIQYGELNSVSLELLRHIDSYNTILLKKQGKDQ